MTDIETKVLARVRKMMKLAMDAGAAEGERDNAMRMAHATLAKYNLDIAQVQADNGTENKEEPREQQREMFYGRPWAREVCFAIGELYFCKYFYTVMPGRNPNKIWHSFIGKHSNAVTAMEMSRFVVEAIHAEAGRYQREHMATHDTYRSFAHAAAIRVASRCRQLRAEATKPSVTAAEPTAPGTALMLSNVYLQERVANDQWVASNMKISDRAGRGAQDTNDWDAARDGRAYGDTVSLNRQVSGKQGRIGRG